MHPALKSGPLGVLRIFLAYAAAWAASSQPALAQGGGGQAAPQPHPIQLQAAPTPSAARAARSGAAAAAAPAQASQGAAAASAENQSAKKAAPEPKAAATAPADQEKGGRRGGARRGDGQSGDSGARRGGGARRGDAATIQNLVRQAYGILDSGLRDYQGHRMQAMLAIDQIVGEKTERPSGVAAGTISQAESDARLRRARDLLQQAAAAATSEHRAGMLKSIDAGIAQINQALQVR